MKGKQLKLKFKGRPAYDSRYRFYDVALFTHNEKIPIWVFGILAQKPDEAKVKAAKKKGVKNYSLERSLAKPRKP